MQRVQSVPERLCPARLPTSFVRISNRFCSSWMYKSKRELASVCLREDVQITAKPIPFSALEGPPNADHCERSVTIVPTRIGIVPWWLNAAVLAMLLPILIYRNLIPAGYKRRCIYHPSCSRYAMDSLKKYGALRGSLIALHRLRRCNGALFKGGFDPA